jgi:hypothetical protein
MLTSGLSFFVLSTEYKKKQISAITNLVARGFTYRDLLIMPIHERSNIIMFINEENSQ